MSTTAAIEATIRDHLVRITRAWKRDDAPGTGNPPAPGYAPRIPLDNAWLTRRAAVEDLAFWVHATDDAGYRILVDNIEPGDVEAYARHLLAHAAALSGWEYAGRLAADLRRTAEGLERITADPKPAVLLGPCPVEVVNADGEREPCGHELRAGHANLDDVRCSRCRTIDTVEGWQRRIIGDGERATADELASRLRALGIRTTATGVRLRAQRGSIPAPIGTDDRGRRIYDVQRTMRAIMAREARMVNS